MYRLLIIDDEYLVRRGLRETIDWIRYGITIVGEATNGKTGLKLAENLKPDIVITDIRMPILDGLQLVKMIRQSEIDCEIIILSGYKDFEYSKEALENGAFCYLLKPIDNNELITRVLESIKELEIKRSQKRLVAEITEDIPVIEKKIVDRLIQGNDLEITNIENKLKAYNLDVPMCGVVVYGIVDNQEIIKNKETIRKLCDDFTEKIGIVLKQKEVAYSQSFHSDGASVFLIGSTNTTKVEEYLKQAVDEFEKQNDEVISIGISKPYENFRDIARCYSDAVSATIQKLFPAINTIDVYKKDVLRYKPVIYEVMQFIANHYSEELSVKLVADSVFVSESYLLHTFKESVSKTFNECLTDYRILIAKKLLLKGNARIYEVAEKVGYSDVKYFSQIFKKKTGLTPKEFIND